MGEEEEEGAHNGWIFLGMLPCCYNVKYIDLDRENCLLVGWGLESLKS